MTQWPNVQVLPDSDIGHAVGFTSDKFSGWCWVEGDRFFISFIESHHPGQGHLRRLIQRVMAHGYQVAVPTPFARMRSILERLGFTPMVEETEMGPCALLVSPKPLDTEAPSVG